MIKLRKILLGIALPILLIGLVACPGFLIDHIQVIAGPSGTIVGAKITFVAVSPFDSSRSAGFFWQFGDGGTGSGKSATHIYTSEGSFIVELRIMLDSGTALDFSKEITIGSASISSASGPRLFNSAQNTSTVFEIDPITDTVVNTFTVGSGPFYSDLIGEKLYVPNVFDDTVSVIDLVSNTVSAPISVGNEPHIVRIVGTKAYVANDDSSTVTVIDTTTDTV